MIKWLGWDCTVVNWHHIDRAISLIQTHSVVIFYRVPAFPHAKPMLEEADRLGLPHYFELDDLIQELRTVGEIRDTLLSEYDVEPDRCERDLLELIANMAAAGLVDVQQKPGA